MKYIAEFVADRIVSVMSGDCASSLVVPKNLEDLPVERLRILDGVVVDSCDYETLFIDKNGYGHIVQSDTTWQPLASKWDDFLISTEGVWRVETDLDKLSVQIKKECKARINKSVSSHTVENLNGEIGRLQFLKPDGWEEKLYKIMDVLSWIREMLATSRALVLAQDADFAQDQKWPVFPANAQALVDEF